MMPDDTEVKTQGVISNVMNDLIKQQNDNIMKTIGIDSCKNPKFVDKKIIDRCQMIIEDSGVNEIKTFCFDGKPLLRFGPITNRWDEDGKIYFEQTVEHLGDK